jgi:hypothetical protein
MVVNHLGFSRLGLRFYIRSRIFTEKELLMPENFKDEMK